MDSNNFNIVLVLGAFAGMLAGFFAIVKYIIAQGMTDRTDDRKERQELIQAIKLMADSNTLIAKATTIGNREAKQRNGHLGDQNVQITKLITDQNLSMEAIRIATQQNAESSQRVETLLEKSATVLASNTATVAEGTAQVAEALRENGSAPQIIDKQVVAHQIISSQSEQKEVQ